MAFDRAHRDQLDPYGQPPSNHPLKQRLKKTLAHIIDRCMTLKKQPTPPLERILSCQLVAHRGAHHRRSFCENSWKAFEYCLHRGIWGVEMDVRFTKDEHPVILHDASTSRVFPDHPLIVREQKLAELSQRLPQIPSLEAIVQLLGRKCHLMIELKEPADTPLKQERLTKILEPWTPGGDFHILSLDTDLFASVGFLPSGCFLPVAEFNTRKMSRWALENRVGGLLGHYSFFSSGLLARHKKAGQVCGTGHVGNKATLFRELNRGVDFIFSDDASRIQDIIDAELEKARAAQ